MKQYDIGIDLGTTSIIIATEEQGVVFRQPTIGAVDTRTNSIIAVGDEALKMLGRAPVPRRTIPPEGRRLPSSTCIRVDLPAPLGPAMMSRCPRQTV